MYFLKILAATHSSPLIKVFIFVAVIGVIVYFISTANKKPVKTVYKTRKPSKSKVEINVNK
jgi:uncharacterized protein with FMN-binding domain